MLRRSLAAVLVFLGFFVAGRGWAVSQPTEGFVENFATGTGEFQGGSARSNPGTGGVDGVGDGFLRVDNDFATNFGTRSGSAAYAGDYFTAGITHIRFWLNDVEGNQAFAIHFGIGATMLNFWQYDPPFVPPENAWAEFEVDLRDSTAFTLTHGTGGSFAGAIQNASNILFRHDLAPYVAAPDPIAGEIGIDKIRFLGMTPVEPATWGRIKALLR